MTRLHIMLFASAASLLAIACGQEEPFIREPDVTPSVSGDNQMSVTVKGLSEVFRWKTGDKITVTGENTSETFTILDPYTASSAKFSGKDIKSKEYGILYSEYGTTVSEIEARTYDGQQQDGNESTSHLGFDMVLEGVTDYKNIEFSKEWAEENGGTLKISNCFKLNLELPGNIFTLSSVRIECDRDVFHSSNSETSATNSISLQFKDAIDVALSDYNVTAYLISSWQPINIQDTDVVTIYVNDGEDTYFSKLPPMTLSVNGGELCDITVPAETWVLYDMTPGSFLNPYQIDNAEDMMAIPGRLEEGRTVYFNLKANVDMSGKNWIPANTDIDMLKSMVFDGCGHTISNLTLDSDSQYPSFAGVLGGTIKDVIFENPVISSNISEMSPAAVVAAQAGRPNGGASSLIENVVVKGASLRVMQQQYSPAGIIAGVANYVTVRGCNADGKIIHAGSNAECNIGGFIGKLEAGCAVSGCSSDVDVTVTSIGRVFSGFIGSIRSDVIVEDCIVNSQLDAHETMRYSGGFIGYLDAKAEIRNCSFTGNVTGGTDYVGGFLGTASKKSSGTLLDNCCFTGNIVMSGDKVKGDGNVGGILGVAQAPITISKCTVTGDISIGYKIDAIGGILGQAEASAEGIVIEKCRFDGNIKEGNNRSWAGGIVGIIRSAGIVRNSWSSGSISKTNHSTGGIVGSLGKNSTIENCFSTMSLLAKHGIGGLVGRADNNDNSASESGWNIRVSGCIAWNTSIKSLNMPAGIDLSKHLSAAPIIGRTDVYNINENCYRRPDMMVECMGGQLDIMYDQDNSDKDHPLLLKHTGKYYVPYNGKAASEGETISDIARRLSWDESVWDLSGNIPSLKNK